MTTSETAASDGKELFAPPPSRPPHHPALDGLRGVAVIAVVVYHHSPGWLPAGFLGVDVFFVLSGFLITGLLITQLTERGQLDLRTFWRNRVRRLAPALLLTLALVALYAWWLAPPELVQRLRGDGLSALGQVANWRFVAEGSSYFVEFLPSPLRHLWSLSVEAQWYVLWPAVLWLVLAATGSLRVALGVALGMAAASAVAMAAVFDAGDPSRAYYGTDTHASPLLIGAILAIALHLAGSPAPGRQQRLAAVGAVLGVAVIAWAMATGSGTAPWLYRGGFVVVAVATAAVLVGAIQPRGDVNPVRSVLSTWPLRQLGIISYGVYLLHWPVNFVVTPDRTGTQGLTLFILRSVVTLGAAVLSYRLIESPIRRGGLGAVRFGRLVAPVAVVGVAALVLVSTTEPAPSWQAEAALAFEERPPPTVPPTTAPSNPEQALPPEPPRVLVVGDSVAYSLGTGLDGSREGLEPIVWNQGVLYCELVQRPRREGGETRDANPSCASWPTLWAEAVESFDPDVVLLHVGPWEVFDRRGDQDWAPFGSVEHDALLRAALSEAVEILSARGATVVLLTVPYLDRTDGVSSTEWTRAERWRVDHLNALLAEIAAGHPQTVRLVDLARWVCPDDCPEVVDGVRIRGDGVHYTARGAEVASDWLVPEVLAGVGAAEIPSAATEGVDG